ALNYEEKLKKRRRTHVRNVPNAISLATCNTAMDLNAAAIITATQSGHTAKIVSHFRPECPIIAVTPYEKIARKLALNWGVFPIVAAKMESTDELIEKSVDIAHTAGYVKNGDLVVIAAGVPVNYVGSTNLMKVHVVGDVLVQGKPIGSGHGFGTAYVAENFKDAQENVQEGEILIVKNLDKSYLELLDKLSGIITEAETVDSEVSIQCMVKEIPIIYNAAGVLDIIKTGCFITMDYRRGIVYSGKINLI
ncbi:MAG: pyruvate kinase, partial [Sedimentibacter sp.]|nr:pyruvate kinase [Sedimentibacter sp.]